MSCKRYNDCFYPEERQVQVLVVVQVVQASEASGATAPDCQYLRPEYAVIAIY